MTSYTYNVLDELEQVNDKTFTYDVMSRVITETDTGLLPTKQIKKEYDYSVDGLLETKKISVGNAVKLHQTYSYDVLDRLSQVYEVEGGEENLVVSYGYDLNGNRISEEVGAKTVDYEYNRNNQVTNVSNKYSNAVISNYSYTYDRYGRQSGKTDTVYENNVGNSSTTT